MALSAPVVLTLSLVALQGGEPAEPAEEAPRVLVLDLEAADVPASEVAIVNGLVAQTLSEKSTFRVVTSDDLRQLLALETEREAVGCDTSSASCLAEIAGAMGTRYVVFGRVGALGKLRIVQLNLYDSDKASAIGRQDRRTERIEDLPHLVEEATAALIGPLVEHAEHVDAAASTPESPSGETSTSGAVSSDTRFTNTGDAPSTEASPGTASGVGGERAASAEGGSVLPWVLMPVGGVAGLAGLVLALGGGAAATFFYASIRDEAWGKETREIFRSATYLAGGAALAGGVVIAAGLATLGVGVLLWE